MSLKEVYITRTAAFLPNNPVSNDEMEGYLGLINDRASKSRRIVLRNNGIKNRYYAIQKDGTATHTNAEMVSLAIRKLFEKNPTELKSVDLISCGTSSPDQMMPSHGVMVHGWLPESGNIEVVSPSGVCCSGMHAMKYAFMSIKSGMSTKAISSGSERLSRVLSADKFELEIQKLNELEENPYLSFDKDFLRWMLSDGAAVFMLEDKKSTDGPSLRIDWVEGISFANEIESCMYMAAEKMSDGTLKSYMDYEPQEMIEKSILSIKQDVKLLDEHIVKLGFNKLKTKFEENNLTNNDVTWFLPHMSSYFFEDKIYAQLADNGMEIPKDRWFSNLATHGNVGAGSIYLMVDELFNSGKLKVGDTILLAVPESSRFSYVFAYLTVC
ncbi:beta-ketoacyl-ACP synthase III [Fluviicola taffensis]|uniref:3-Oxoacyl-(Acyl-carrier-protein (ACP)) synthase III domain-containing protein n=1 Tax=Fluviicola taffensis (strain DSM 16823 / NCIMB 13979 / RW262) TaxID=755732 RepID=F2IEB7_FLUTR|nr:3-Oxoacyl-(acyl-carrier-protein (ACP)) synthase III domain-containing protein [Fluviicola taffensis DSM 16823]